jgi:hypothetical protein
MGAVVFGVFALSPPAQPSQAAPSPSTHSIPGGFMQTAGVDTQCFDGTGFTCAGGGYNGTSGQIGGNGWASWQYWSFGTLGPAGTGSRHNCTTYVAYRLQQNGYAYPGWTDNATGWDTDANGTPVDQNPVVGAIAQWNSGTGHVAYVEEVTADYIVTTSDSLGGGTDRQKISRTSAYMPDNFIHFKDAAPPPSPYIGHIVQWSDGTAWLVGPDGNRRWIKDERTYYCLIARGVPLSGVLDAATLNALPDLTGVRAQCPPGDINTDGVVNVIDLSYLLTNYGKSYASAGYNGNADLNDDGHSDIIDVSVMMSNWGRRG